MTRAHISLLPQDDEVQARREADGARDLLVKAGLDVPADGHGGEVEGTFDAILETAQAVRVLVAQGGYGRLTTLLKLDVDHGAQDDSEKRASGA